MRSQHIWVWVALAGTAACAHGQWVNHPTPGTPRTRDGKPDLSARPPRTSNGKADLSGIWVAEPATREELLRLFPGGENNLGEISPSRYFMNIFSDFKPEEVPIRPAAAAIAQGRRVGLAKDIPLTRCLPAGVPLVNALPAPYKLIQTPGSIAMLYEQDTSFRQIFIDGRKLPADPQPSWLGYSVGKWDGDSLIVDTAGFNDRSWLDAFGHPHSEAMRVTERFRRRDFGHMEVQITVNDPVMYTKPFTIKFTHLLQAESDILETFCSENEKDRAHMLGLK
jgi:hypothetical protein